MSKAQSTNNKLINQLLMKDLVENAYVTLFSGFTPTRTIKKFTNILENNQNAYVLEFSGNKLSNSGNLCDPQYTPIILVILRRRTTLINMVHNRWYYIVNDVLYERLSAKRGGYPNRQSGLTSISKHKLYHVVLKLGEVPKEIKILVVQKLFGIKQDE